MNPGADRCARCGGAFHCGVADPTPCACTTIALDAEALAALRARYTGCLCLACLADVAAHGDRDKKAGPVSRPAGFDDDPASRDQSLR